MIAIYSFALALFLATALVPVLVRFAGPLGLIDRPDERKIHTAPVPRIGGIAIIAGALVALIIWRPLTSELAAYFAGAMLVGVVGVWDDRANLGYRLKFFVQIAAALVVVLWGDALVTRAPFVLGATLPDWLSVPLSVLVIVGVTNAVNLSDGVDGLAGGTSLLASGALGLLAYLADDRGTALFALCLMGATLGFLRYNTFPARVFMGDAGSQFLGFSVAVLGITLIERSNAVLSPLVPVVVLGLPILDTLYVMTRRVLDGRSAFAPDRRHLHHRLLDLGLNQYESVLVIYTAQAVLIGLAWWLAYASDVALLGVYGAFCALVLIGLNILERRYRAELSAPGRQSLATRVIGRLRERRLLSRLPRQLIAGATATAFVLAPVLANALPQDVGWMALLFLVALVLAIAVPSIPLPAVERVAAYVLAVATAYFLERWGIAAALCPHCVHGFFALLVLAVAVWMRFGGERAFRVNTLDFLIVAIVLVVPNIPEVRGTGLGVVAMQALVLFYATEIIVTTEKPGWGPFRLSIVAALGIIAVRGLLPHGP